MNAKNTVVSTVAAVGLAVGLTLVGAMPANAAQLGDVNMDVASSQVRAASGTDDAANVMPGNPEAALPDAIAQNIPDNAEVVSEDHALTANGALKDLATGNTVTDPKLVGTRNSQPDPLAKTDGASFIPVEVGTVKTKIDDAAKTQDGASQSADKAGNKATVRLASLPNNDSGAYWGTYNGTPAFFESNGNLFAQQARGVIDVSEWQGDIDWAKAKSAGVEGAIIRISYGWGNGYDKKALRNISECKRLGIPFGIYMYSYAENSGNAASEGADVASLLRKAGVNPGDLKYPVYYDLEAWSWTGHAHPTSPSVYDGIVNAWFNQLRNAGYGNLAVYSYTSYLSSELNSSNIHAKTRWVAQYGSRMGYTAWSSNDRGWQYSASAHINGISGSVDVSAFGGKTYVQTGKWVQKDGRQYWQEADGTYARGKEIYDPSTNAWYWIDSDGTMARNKDVYLRSNGGKWVRYDENGHMIKGEDYRYGGWYDFDYVTGAMSKGLTYVNSDDGKWVYYDDTTGKMIYGEKYLNVEGSSAGWYYFDPITGKRVTGDVYLRSNGGKWVRYDQNGKMVKGLQRQDGSWYFFDSTTGAMAHGRTWVPQWNAWHNFDAVTGRG